MKKRGPIIYIDTNIGRDYTERRDIDSVYFLETIRDKKWNCISSVFLIMELSDIEKDKIFFNNKVIKKNWDVDHFLRERRKKDLREEDFNDLDGYVDIFLRSLKFISFYDSSEKGWNLALHLSTHSNLSATDLIHLATAFSLDSDIFVTRDEYLIKEGNKIIKNKSLLANLKIKPLKICRPKEAISILNRMGFK